MLSGENNLNNLLHQDKNNKQVIIEKILNTKLTVWEVNLIKAKYPLFYEKPNSNAELIVKVLNLLQSNREQEFDFDKQNYIEDTFSNVSDGEINVSGSNYIYKLGEYYFEWDIEHSKGHQLTIDEVAKAMLNTDKYPVLDTRNDYGERRYRILCKLESNLYLSAFLYKYSPNCIRIITAMKIDERRFKRYDIQIYGSSD